MPSTSPSLSPSTCEAEKILQQIMLADRRVLRNRAGRSDEPGRVISNETREKLRAAGRRGASKTNHKSQPAIVSPDSKTSEGRAYG